MADPEAIQRVLFVASPVHVYAIPPLTSSTRGFAASSWTQDPRSHIFTARLRVIETSHHGDDEGAAPRIRVDMALEDPSSGELFAGAPYERAEVVQSANDSARFFAVRVQGDGGRKATLGIGFEDRGQALDFNVALADARKALGWERAAAASSAAASQAPKQEWGLKDGETLRVEIGGLRRTGTGEEIAPPSASGIRRVDSLGLSNQAFGDGGGLLPPPPPPASRHDRRRSREIGGLEGPGEAAPAQDKKKLEDLGFDDGEFGEFV